MRMVAKRVLKYPDIYESYNSGILVMSRFYITAARILEKNGVDSVLYLAEFERGIGMYLHGKKYGVTPELYASRLMEKFRGGFQNL